MHQCFTRLRTDIAVAAASFKTRLDHYLNIDDVANVDGCAGDSEAMKRRSTSPACGWIYEIAVWEADEALWKSKDSRVQGWCCVMQTRLDDARCPVHSDELRLR